MLIIALDMMLEMYHKKHAFDAIEAAARTGIDPSKSRLAQPAAV